ncbi:hypothetical protein [Trichothermofontia sp.]
MMLIRLTQDDRLENGPINPNCLGSQLGTPYPYEWLAVMGGEVPQSRSA